MPHRIRRIFMLELSLNGSDVASFLNQTPPHRVTGAVGSTTDAAGEFRDRIPNMINHPLSRTATDFPELNPLFFRSRI